VRALRLTRSTRIDWPAMACNLRTLGVSWQQIADALEIDRMALPNWAHEGAIGEPAHWTGAAFIALWCDRTGLQWTDVPTRTVAPSVSRVLRATA
jgi:hypothetical protein